MKNLLKSFTIIALILSVGTVMGKKREELYQPILAKAEVAVQAVAKAEGFAYVFDTANQALVYFDGGIDITPLVKTKLGIK